MNIFSSLSRIYISTNLSLKAIHRNKRFLPFFSSFDYSAAANSVIEVGLSSFIKNEEATINQIQSRFAEPYVNLKDLLEDVISSCNFSPSSSSLYNFYIYGSIRKPSIDIAYILNHTKEVEKNLELRGVTDCNLQELVGAYHQLQKVNCEVEKYEQIKQNAVNEKDTRKVSHASNVLSILQNLHKELEKIYFVNALALPNKTYPLSFSGNGTKRLVIETVGKKPTFEHDVYDHIYLGKRLKSIRQNNMSRMAGQRNCFFFGGIAELEHALICYTIDKLKRRGFFMVSVPNILKDAVFEGAGLIDEKLNSMVYKIENSSEPNFYLSGTSEIGLCAYFSSHAVHIVDLPLKVCCVSTCYRKETATRLDRKGIFRIHQFLKVEMFGIAANETGLESANLLDEFLQIQKELFSELRLHFEVVNMPANELGLPAYRKIDIEAWFPGRNKYDEIASASNCTDYQSRRLNILYQNKNLYKHAHTVNATACAIPRMIIALLENGQQANYEIALPPCLWPYMNGKKHLRKEYIKALEYVGIDQSRNKQEKIMENLLD